MIHPLFYVEKQERSMYNKQDVLHMVFTSLLDGSLTTKNSPRLEAWTDLKNHVVIPLFNFIEKYKVFTDVGFSSVSVKEITDTLNKCLFTYQELNGWEHVEHISNAQVIQLFETLGIKCKVVKGEKIAIYINKKITKMMQEALE